MSIGSLRHLLSPTPLDTSREPTEDSVKAAPEPSLQVERYFCLVEAPSFLKRRNGYGIIEPELSIFYSDSVAPTSPSAGITQEKVHDLLWDEFGDLLALDKRAHAYHWIPDVSLLKLETSPGHWTPAVAVLFVKNSDKPVEPIEEWVGSVKEQIVRQWDQLKPYSSTLDPKHIVPTGSSLHSTTSNPGNGVVAQTDILRGRKRRRARRKGLLFSALTDTTGCLREPSPAKGVVVAETDVTLADGGIRRRARKHIELSPFDIEGFGSGPKAQTTAMSGTPLVPSYLSRPSFEIGWSPLANGHDLPEADAASLVRNAVCLTIRLAPVRFRTRNNMSPIISRFPVLSIRPRAPGITRSSGPLVPNELPKGPMRSYLLSDDFESRPWPTSNDYDTDSESGYSQRLDEGAGKNEGRPAVFGSQKEDTSESAAVLDAEAIVAKLEDSTGVVHQPTALLFNYCYIDSIEVDSSVPELHASVTHPVYWSRLALLILGHAGQRKLPYSQGFGVEHFNPNLIRRDYRWGYYEVDDISWLKASAVPTWRAAWNFENPAGIPGCQCELASTSDIRHNIESCRDLVQDIAQYRYWRTPAQVSLGASSRITCRYIYLGD
ncbi:hypothetical protein GGS23DRAFT_118789 [Durotheca rogersii]|uniref:uncharacterized protein n=1 Tax=Durotheca rogersii TaxID=419775 RepID=UPI002220ECA4|nr:uncharacterized protein GGS23DRAFT_118789 [Durotheca rogersii]KAI5861909.1 hypothetical protein GGS23DRAFT_118789 [Durotheca rogersii]